MPLHNIHDEIARGPLPESGRAFRTPAGCLMGWGPTVPADGATGYAHGAIFHHTDGEDEEDALYVNIGDADSANFNAATVAGDA